VTEPNEILPLTQVSPMKQMKTQILNLKKLKTQVLISYLTLIFFIADCTVVLTIALTLHPFNIIPTKL